MKQLWDGTAELAGISNFLVCIQDTTLQNCGELAADVLIGAKLKALERAYGRLKLLKRGCKVAGRSTVQTLAAAGLPCGMHDVPGLPGAASQITNGPGDCQACAERIRDSLGDGQVVRFGPAGPFFGNYRGQGTINWDNGYHAVVVLNDRVYDAFTPKGGESIAEYKAKWDYGDIIDFGF
ncbi:hypothetical protein [Streptomyces sp. NBC_00334]|uniref:hypothetical protein n=1 Tax=Streptomyces sp. NBC_00334 TaxID=2975713 RepID=UPI002E2A44B5|nr:hypothetical protein [Streptomyces sp. NBC_00334]